MLVSDRTSSYKHYSVRALQTASQLYYTRSLILVFLLSSQVLGQVVRYKHPIACPQKHTRNSLQHPRTITNKNKPYGAPRHYLAILLAHKPTRCNPPQSYRRGPQTPRDKAFTTLPRNHRPNNPNFLNRQRPASRSYKHNTQLHAILDRQKQSGCSELRLISRTDFCVSFRLL
ncbi:hypothetical protein GGI42DRAFT_142173 [Trichoderma sp. SZMC 28013]